MYGAVFSQDSIYSLEISMDGNDVPVLASAPSKRNQSAENPSKILTERAISFLRGETSGASLSSEDSDCLRRAVCPLLNIKYLTSDSKDSPSVDANMASSDPMHLGTENGTQESFSDEKQMNDNELFSPKPPLPPRARVSLNKVKALVPRARHFADSKVHSLTSSSRASLRIVGDVADAFRFMEDSPMFRARLAGFEKRTEKLLQKLSKVVKTTERYLTSGKAFAKATALLASEFIEMSGTFVGTEKEGNGSELHTLLRGLGDTLHEMEAGHQTLLLTLEHAFIAKIKGFVDSENSRSAHLKKTVRKARDAYDSALHKSLSLRADQNSSPVAEEKDLAVANSFASFELERFRLVRYYNQLEQRKSFELVEGICALLYSYKAHFNSSAEAVEELVPHLLQVQSSIQDERLGFGLSDNVWRRREEQLADMLAKDGETLAMTFTSGNDEYPIEAFSSKVVEGKQGTCGINFNKIDHMGYLLKLSTSVRKDWKRRWFVLQGGNLYYVRDWNDKKPTLVCEVLLSTIRVCTGPKALRHSFELISPNRRNFKLQACSEVDMKGWIVAMQRVTESLLVGGGSDNKRFGNNGNSDERTMRNKSGHAANDIASLGRSLSFAKKTRAGVVSLLAANTKCADCDSESPDWVSINIGSIVCLRCSGVHRSLGAHISKMRSLTLDRLEPTLLTMLQKLGNVEINRIYEADLSLMAGWKRPTSQSSIEDVKQFIRAKYEHRGFVDQMKVGVDPKENEALLNQRLFDAATSNDVCSFLYCLAHGANVNSHPSGKHESPIHVSCRHGSVDTLLLSILNGGDLGKVNANGLSPLDVALTCNQTGAIDCCLSHMKSGRKQMPSLKQTKLKPDM